MAYKYGSTSKPTGFPDRGPGNNMYSQQSKTAKPSRLGGPPGFESTDPIKVMKVRANRASNLGPAKVRNGGTKFHAGHDLAAPRGTPVYAVMEAKVIVANDSDNGGYGKSVLLAHYHWKDDPRTYKGAKAGPTYYTYYSHLDSVDVSKNDWVKMGAQIGTVGTTGNAADHADDNHPDIHLHFEFGTKLRSSGKYISKEHLLSPNRVYRTVKFGSQKPHAKNQTDKGVVRYDLVNGHVWKENQDGTRKWDGAMPEEI